MQLFNIDGVQLYYISEGESFNAAIALLHNQRQGQWGLPIAAIDTETNGANPRIHQVRLLQIAQPNCPAVVFDLGGFTLTTAQRQLLNGFLGDSTLLKVLQGGKFDLKMLAAMGLMLSPPFFDTMLVSQIVTAGRDLKHTLGDLALRYLGIELDKSLQASFVGMAIDNPLSPQQLKYGAIDVLVLLKLLPVLADSLKKFKSSQTTWQREQRLLPVLAALETGGVQVDEGALRQLRYDLIVEQDKAGEALQAMLNYGDDIDLMGDPLTIDLTNSRELKQAVEGLGLGVTSIDDTDLLAKAHYQEIAAVLEYLKWAKQLKAIDDTLNQIEPLSVGMSRVSNLYPRYTQLEHRTGRLSSSRTGIETWGMCCGRLNQSAIKVLKPRYQGTILLLLTVDEAPIRMLTRVTQDPWLAYIYGALYQDGFGASAWLMGAIGCSEVEAWALWIGAGIYHYRAKKWQMFSYQEAGIVLSESVAKSLLERFWAKMPELEQWHKQHPSTIEGRSTLCDRYLLNDRASHADRVGHLVFGTLSDLTKQSAMEMGRSLYPLRGKPYLILRDTLIWEVPIYQTEQSSRLAQQVVLDVYRRVLGTTCMATQAAIASVHLVLPEALQFDV